ncbi:leucine-rich repeat domain-containing protein [Flavobacterium flavigenum]|uniref:leucine-rich repeat domain-containing protein n=1 Tax=Flavobacterium flavigenum TaxID=3003258 RepID=UPI0024826497|nr:leucine-rich repeat domain-containing protein [Flavobacterium flavigenum]
MTNIFKIKKYWIITLFMILFSLVSFAQEYNDKTIGFDADRITLALKKRGLTDDDIHQEVALMRKLQNEQYIAMKKNDEEILQKITSEQVLPKETNKTSNTKLTAKTASTLVADIPQTEKDALLALYNSTNGNNWTKKTGWDFSTPVTSGWYGITVTAGHVTGINLSNNNLNGIIPSSIGQLTELQTFYLNQNQLIGTIPSEIRELTKLTLLYLHTNQLSGTIPAEIGQLTKLTSLQLHINKLSGTIPAEIGKLTSLTSLLLYNNQLTGIIPNVLGELTKLLSLQLHMNQLTGTIPDEIGQLTKLQTLYLHSNRLTGTIPVEIGQLTQLQRLYLCNNQLTGTIPSEIGQLKEILELFLYNNQLKGAIPFQIGGLTKLSSLQLHINQLSGMIPSEIGQLTKLQKLFLNNNQLSEKIPDEIGQLTQLTSLQLHFNQLSGKIPASIGQQTQLQSLYLNNNKLSDNIPIEIGKLTKVTYVNLSNNTFTGQIPAEIGQLVLLQNLYLNNNQLSGTIPAAIGQLLQLKLVFFDTNRLEGPIPDLTNVISQIKFVTNKFRFADFASQYSAYKSKLTLFEYSNQAKTDSEVTLTKAAGETQTITMYEDNRFTPADTYQWYKNGVAIAGATSRQYTLSNLTTANAGDYYCVSTNPQMTITTVTNQNLVLTRNTIHLKVNNCNAFLSSAVGTNVQITCPSTAITPITYTTAGLITGATFSGLPSGVTGNFSSNTVTISGTPATTGTFAYTVTYTGSCGTVVTSKGTITISNKTVNAASASPVVCINTAITPITHTTSGGTLTLGTPSGLPAGVTAAWASNILTISGTPTASGVFNYSIPVLGGCGDTINATGKITVSAPGTITLSSSAGTDNQSKNINTILTPITYTTTGTTGAAVTGLPAGVTGSFASNTVTITGTPTVSGTFNYLITLPGECNTTISGKITSLCEPITGVIKIINEPTPTSYPFQFSSSGTVRLSACSKTEFPNTFYAATATLSVGTILYTNEALTTPLAYGSLWYKNQANGTSNKVDSSGKIVTITTCGSGSDPDSGPGYAFQFSTPRLQRDCGAITFPVTYYAATNFVGVGTTLYTSKSLTTALGGGYWIKLADSNFAYLIGNGGILSSEFNCGVQ